MCREPYALGFVPDHLKTGDMCKKAIEKGPSMLKYSPDCLKTQKMYKWVVEKIGFFFDQKF